MDEVTVWSRALDAARVAQLMWDMPSGMESGLEAYWSLDETSGTTAVDVFGNFDGTLVNMESTAWVPVDRDPLSWEAPPANLRAWPVEFGGISLRWDDLADLSLIHI